MPQYIDPINMLKILFESYELLSIFRYPVSIDISGHWQHYDRIFALRPTSGRHLARCQLNWEKKHLKHHVSFSYN